VSKSVVRIIVLFSAAMLFAASPHSASAFTWRFQ
jgi:hypothetical protein